MSTTHHDNAAADGARNMAKRTAPALKINAEPRTYGEDVRLVCLVRSWPSLGITPDAPLYGLRGEKDKVLAEGTDAAALVKWARGQYATVRRGTGAWDLTVAGL